MSTTRALLTQVALEVPEAGGDPATRLTQFAREVLEAGGDPTARLTQLAREVLIRQNWWNPDDGAVPATSETAVLVQLSWALAEAAATATGEVPTPATEVNMDPLDGVYLHCYTGDGEPVGPEAAAFSLNYVF